ncbi:tRNA glutamyl-Q(34) synthetase GluQRS [Diaphorobacter sp. HDW4B]|uniref:tRNA glutamyl-Q(34) synthetase GluQRS n=1 Tax=Diaphorobacter sp. HDW4B TaxID=2714925 RepID=UPI00140B67B0|nr:tRNA glutamyl-Q(34) synthetase GluQRS [Diaphorobacter sp. HDW4B]QIL73720.1 tRNA glutamyl-Q(34) synthetase GluQRS [Diaphorobacter sp. HDW4B]
MTEAALVSEVSDKRAENRTGQYVGRFAPSPTGPLHAGSLVAALASWLDARAAGGRWLVRIEDVDQPRCSQAAADTILSQLAACQLLPDEPPLYQTQRTARYQQLLDQLLADHWAYPCGCTRRDIALALESQGQTHERHTEQVYPGTCRDGLHGHEARSWRFHTSRRQQSSSIDSRNERSITLSRDGVSWQDRRLGAQFQDVASAVGDFVLLRADGIWAYQIAVVADDADQGITHIVRGEDLTDNTARQIMLQATLGFQSPAYLHTPLVRAADGEKLSKQHGAPAIDSAQPLVALCLAAAALGLPVCAAQRHGTIAEALAFWVSAWPYSLN